jgi:DNA-binding LacI/PurR family transcriptional regulator
LAALLTRSVDGVIISPVDAVKSRTAVAAASKRVPLVQVDRHINVESDIVSVDHSRGIQLVIEHLVAEGRSSFAFVTTARRVNIASERLEAYVRCVRPIDEAPAEFSQATCRLPGAWKPLPGLRTVTRRRRSSAPTT